MAAKKKPAKKKAAPKKSSKGLVAAVAAYAKAARDAEASWHVMAYEPILDWGGLYTKVWVEPPYKPSDGPAEKKRRLRGFPENNVADFPVHAKMTDAQAAEWVAYQQGTVMAPEARLLFVRMETRLFADLEDEERAENGGPFDHDPSVEEYAEVMGEPPATTTRTRGPAFVSIFATPDTVLDEAEAMIEDDFKLVKYLPGTFAATQKRADALVAKWTAEYDAMASGGKPEAAKAEEAILDLAYNAFSSGA